MPLRLVSRRLAFPHLAFPHLASSRAAFVLAAGLLVAPLAPAQAASLSEAGGFNALIFGDLGASGGDTEGRLAVGGDLTVQGSYSVGGCSSPDCERRFDGSSQPQSYGTRDDLVVGGALLNSGGATVSWNQPAGNVVVGGAIAPSVSITSAEPTNTVSQNVGDVSGHFDFAAAQSGLIAASGALAGQAATGAIVQDDASYLALKGTDPDLNVFDVTAPQWNSTSYGKLRIIDVPAGSRVLINVAGTAIDAMTGAVYFGAADCFSLNACEAATDYAPNVMVNYYEALVLEMSQFEHQGSVLAPLAALVASGGAINGQSILAAATSDTGFEFHFRDDLGADFSDLAGASSVVPLPAAAPLLAAALAALGLAARRRG